MDYLFLELPPARKEELDSHLAACHSCALRLRAWRGSLDALDAWQLPETSPGSISTKPLGQPGPLHSESSPARRPWLPALKWVAAAALMMGLGFVLGRQTNPWARDLAVLKTSVARLSDTLERERSLNASNTVALAAAAAQDQTLRLLAEYSRAEADRNANDQQTLKFTVQDLGGRLTRLQSELETVAVNTQDGFQQTHQNLARLVSYHPATAVPSPLNR
jgi:anti-sigma factor RsiW